jgi:hypothetical protein
MLLQAILFALKAAEDRVGDLFAEEEGDVEGREAVAAGLLQIFSRSAEVLKGCAGQAERENRLGLAILEPLSQLISSHLTCLSNNLPYAQVSSCNALSAPDPIPTTEAGRSCSTPLQGHVCRALRLESYAGDEAGAFLKHSES